MAGNSGAVTATLASLALPYYAGPALGQKPGGTLRMYHFDSPASLSLHEEVTYAALRPAMGLFNNLIMFDQHIPQSGFNTVVPDLATEWSWDSSKTELRFRLPKPAQRR
jgi:peptide/nickel transport system substrate-binding protein